jgi:16S rRNA (uracil1498-N3)-methyltransferase
VHRFFIPPKWITPPTVHLQGQIARQIKTVLRMQVGDELMVLDDSGTEWQVKITEIGKETVEAHIVDQRPSQNEPTVQITLYQGTLKGQKFEWVLQKGTELGVSRFVPTICERSVVNRVDVLTKKYSRWQEIIREAAEQSRRGKLPVLEAPVSLADAVNQAQSESLMIMTWEGENESTLKSIISQAKVKRISIFIGPEGGFTKQEAALVREAGGEVVKLGPRILRAETAGLAVCAAILYEMDAWM